MKTAQYAAVTASAAGIATMVASLVTRLWDGLNLLAPF
jgi:hypothetical protein